MRRMSVGTGVVLMLTLGSQAWAGTWCDNFPGAIFCDSFDTYCFGTETNPCPPSGGTKNPGPLRQVWHNTSMNYRKDQACGALMTVEDDYTQCTSSPYGGRICNDGITALGELGQAKVDLLGGLQARFGDQFNEVWGGEDQTAQGGPDERLHLQFNMSGGIQGANALWGSAGYLELALEQNPYNRNIYHDVEVTPTDYILVGGDEGAGCLSCRGLCQQQFGVADVPMRAQMATICQSYDARVEGSLCPDPANPNGPRIPCGPPYCPPVPESDIHTTLAIGALGFLDPNPCHCEMPNYVDPTDPRVAHNNVPSNYHLAFFDGWKWRMLTDGSKVGDGTGSGEFWVGAKYDYVEIWVKPTTVDIYHKSKRWIYNDPLRPQLGGHMDSVWRESRANNIPRKYLGGFNVIRSGTSPGCALTPNSTDWTCVQWAGTQCLRVGGKLYYGAPDSCDGNAVLMPSESHVSLDSVALTGGRPEECDGACCLPDGSCTTMKNTQCASAGGTSRGCGVACGASTCEGACCQPRAVCTQTLPNACPGVFGGAGTDCTTSKLCCPTPFADWDVDGDVDATDFSALQRCVTDQTVPTSALNPECTCFDRNGDDLINQADVLSFINCASGPDIPAGPGCGS